MQIIILNLRKIARNRRNAASKRQKGDRKGSRDAALGLKGGNFASLVQKYNERKVGKENFIVLLH